jgi:hypothetical protein
LTVLSVGEASNARLRRERCFNGSGGLASSFSRVCLQSGMQETRAG